MSSVLQFAGTKLVLASDVDADGAGWIEVLDGFSKHAQRRERSKTMASGKNTSNHHSLSRGMCLKDCLCFQAEVEQEERMRW